MLSGCKNMGGISLLKGVSLIQGCPYREFQCCIIINCVFYLCRGSNVMLLWQPLKMRSRLMRSKLTSH